MNDNERSLIRCVCKNDMDMAKQYAKLILSENKAKSNERFCADMLRQLETKKSFELPPNLQSMLFVEDPLETMNVNRYYLSTRESKIAERIMQLNAVSKKLAELGVNYVNSTLLYGNSGTGKTTFGRYIAYRLGLPFAYLNFSHVINEYLGGTVKNLTNIFDFVKQKKFVLMLDEIDAVGIKRGTKSEVGELSRIVIGLMQCLDNLTSDTVLIAATNRIDILDPALLRRFTVKHRIIELNRIESKEMIHMFFSDVGVSIDETEADFLAATEGSQAELMNQMVMMLVQKFSREGEMTVS